MLSGLTRLITPERLPLPPLRPPPDDAPETERRNRLRRPHSRLRVWSTRELSPYLVEWRRMNSMLSFLPPLVIYSCSVLTCKCSHFPDKTSIHPEIPDSTGLQDLSAPAKFRTPPKSAPIIFHFGMFMPYALKCQVFCVNNLTFVSLRH